MVYKHTRLIQLAILNKGSTVMLLVTFEITIWKALSVYTFQRRPHIICTGKIFFLQSLEKITHNFNLSIQVV